MGKYNGDFLDAMSMMSFAIGLINYRENLAQSNKDDIMKEVDQQTQIIIEKLEKSIEYKNELLIEIRDMLKE